MDVNVTPFEQFDLSDLDLVASGLGSGCSCVISSEHLSPKFLILPHICTVVSHFSVNVHLVVVSHPRHSGGEGGSGGGSNKKK